MGMGRTPSRGEGPMRMSQINNSRSGVGLRLLCATRTQSNPAQLTAESRERLIARFYCFQKVIRRDYDTRRIMHWYASQIFHWTFALHLFTQSGSRCSSISFYIFNCYEYIVGVVAQVAAGGDRGAGGRVQGEAGGEWRRKRRAQGRIREGSVSIILFTSTFVRLRQPYVDGTAVCVQILQEKWVFVALRLCYFSCNFRKCKCVNICCAKYIEEIIVV